MSWSIQLRRKPSSPPDLIPKVEAGPRPGLDVYFTFLEVDYTFPDATPESGGKMYGVNK